MKKLLNEAYEWKLEKKTSKDGNLYYVAIIDPSLSTDDTFEVKDKIKEYGGKWDNIGRRWYFILSADKAKRDAQIEKWVKPCVSYLKSVEKTPNGKSVEDEIQSMLAEIDQVVTVIDKNPSTGSEVNAVSKDKIKSNLLDFKRELIDSFKNNTFREKMGPIIKFRQAQGPGYSLLNSFLVLSQKPNAKMVKSAGNWKKANKSVKPGARAIWLWVPLGNRAHTPDEMKEIETQFLKKYSKLYGKVLTSKNELNVGDREKLERKLNEVTAEGFDLMPRFYDVSDVIQMNGKEDLVGSIDGLDDVQWYDGETEPDEKSEKLFGAILSTIQEFGIDVSYADDLGGARGVSMGGRIQVLKNAPKSIGTVSTLVHELSHELLHQTYLKDKGNEKENFGSYFVGEEYGTKIVEQQAEISAWIVMRNFGYDMQTAKNYTACWGGDEKTAAYAFDSVAKVATRIIKGMNENLSVVNESLTVGGTVTGLDVAKLVGMEDIYMKGKQGERDKVAQKFGEMLERIENVKF